MLSSPRIRSIGVKYIIKITLSVFSSIYLSKINLTLSKTFEQKNDGAFIFHI